MSDSINNTTKINFSKEYILSQIEDMKNIRDAYYIENIYNQKLYIIYLNSIDGIEITITNCGLKYKIEIKKDKDYSIFNSGETLYSSLFNPIISYKIRQVVKQHKENKRIKKLKEILSQ